MTDAGLLDQIPQQARALLRATWAEVDAGELDADGARHRFTDLTVRSA